MIIYKFKQDELPHYCNHPLLHISDKHDDCYTDDELEIYQGPGTYGLHRAITCLTRAIATHRHDVKIVEAFEAMTDIQEAVEYSLDGDDDAIDILAAYKLFEDKGPNRVNDNHNPSRFRELNRFIRHMYEDTPHMINRISNHRHNPRYDETYYRVIHKWVRENTNFAYPEFYYASDLRFYVPIDEYNHYMGFFSNPNYKGK